MHRRLERPADIDLVADDDGRRLARGGALRVGVRRIGVDPDELIRGHEVQPLLLDAELSALLEHRVEIVRCVDALLHERAYEVVATGILAEVIEKHVREAVVRSGRIEVGPVVQLSVRDAQVGLTVRREKTVGPLAQDGVSLVEPHRRTPSRVELDHVAELVSDRRFHVRRPQTVGECVEIDQLALRRELVHPDRLLV